MSIFNSSVRVKILAILYGMEYCEFTYLAKEIGTSEGNLWGHLKRLESEECVIIKKCPFKKRMRTIVKITDKGRAVFKNYIYDLVKVSNILKIDEDEDTSVDVDELAPQKCGLSSIYNYGYIQ